MSKKDEELRQRIYENFETQDILDSVDNLDNIRGILADGDHCRPPEIRNSLLKLHKMTFDFVNGGRFPEDDEENIWDLSYDIEAEISSIIEYSENILSVLDKLQHLAPDPDDEFYGEED